MHEFLVSAAAFIVLLGIMVVVHEFGHFAVAKLCRVRVEAFSVGFGPRLFGIKYGDTDYKICLLPFGGYVKMTGETPDSSAEADGEAPAPYDPAAFSSHPRWQRMLIGLAGPTSNFILAFVAMTFYFGWINESPAFEVNDTRIEWVTPGSPAAQAGLQTGDVIRQFADADEPTWYMVDAKASLNLNQTVPVTVERGTQTMQLSLHLPAEVKNDDFDVTDAGLFPQQVSGPIEVHQVVPGTPADQGGLRAGDAIQSVDGHEFHTVQVLLATCSPGRASPSRWLWPEMAPRLLRSSSTRPRWATDGSLALRRCPLRCATTRCLWEERSQSPDRSAPTVRCSSWRFCKASSRTRFRCRSWPVR
jgi:regulator of sigma E protease